MISCVTPAAICPTAAIFSVLLPDEVKHQHVKAADAPVFEIGVEPEDRKLQIELRDTRSGVALRWDRGSHAIELSWDLESGAVEIECRSAAFAATESER